MTIVKLMTEHHLEFQSFKVSLHLSTCHIVGNHMSRPIYFTQDMAGKIFWLFNCKTNLALLKQSKNYGSVGSRLMRVNCILTSMTNLTSLATNTILAQLHYNTSSSKIMYIFNPFPTTHNNCHLLSLMICLYLHFQATIHSLVNDIDLIDSCQAHLPVQDASNI